MDLRVTGRLLKSMLFWIKMLFENLEKLCNTKCVAMARCGRYGQL